MSDESPEVGEIWVHRQTGRRATIMPGGQLGIASYTIYKYIPTTGGSHTAMAQKDTKRFLRDFLRESPGSAMPSYAVLPRAAASEDTVAAVRSWLDVVAARLVAKASAHDGGTVAAALREVADAFFPSSASGEIPATREALLTMSVVDLIVLCRLATGPAAAIRILDGEVFVDGELVTDPEAQITTVKRERFAVRCGSDSAVVKVVG